MSYNHRIEQDEELVKDGVRYIYLKVRDDKWDLLSGYSSRIKRVRNYLEGIVNQYDLMHIHGTEQQYQVMGGSLKIPKVLSAQGFVTKYYKYLPARPQFQHVSWAIAGYYEKRYTETVRHFICRTHWDKAVIRELQPQAVIHHNWELIRPEFYKPITPSPTKPGNALLFVGGVNSIKGIREALCALNLLVPGIPVRMIVTGYGTKADLVGLISSLSLQNIRGEDIEHRGMLNAAQLWNTYEEAFCLLHPSYIDNSPNSVCEAQLAGLPVIATNVGGVPSLIENYETGLLTSLNSQEIAQAVQTLWERPTLRQRLAAKAREVSLQRYDVRTITDTTKTIYRAVLADSD
ncbi:hypothetical protein GCM10027299_03080 [Larkinella ripae]